MPQEIELMSAQAVRDKFAELEARIKSIEIVKILPSNAGHLYPGEGGGQILDLSGFLTIDMARQVGLPV